MKSKPPINPYAAGILLGIVLTASYAILGAGLGASAGPARLTAGLCRSIGSVDGYFAALGEQPLQYYLFWMFIGVFVGGGLTAWINGRAGLILERGSKASRWTRIILALCGGILAGWAGRIAQGCTSGQALSGSALLLTGSLLFMGCVFVGGYLSAYFFRRQWHD